MKNLFIIIVSFFIFFDYSYGQENYIVLPGISSVDPSVLEKESLETATNALISELEPSEQATFKVYDFGFYLLADHFNNNDDWWENFKRSIEPRPESEYYIIFGRVLSEGGAPVKIKVDVNLPSQNCLNKDERDRIQKYANEVANENYSLSEFDREIATLNAIGDFVFKIKCDCTNNGGDCTFTKFRFIDSYLLSYGFKKKEARVNGTSDWNDGQHEIYDYSEFKNVVIDGESYCIPELIKDGKILYDNPTTITTEDTSFVIDPIDCSVYILDNESFLNIEWITAKDASINKELVQYFIILKDEVSNKYFVYSRFSFGPLLPLNPIALQQGNAESISPMGVLIDFGFNIAMGAGIEMFQTRFLNAKVYSWNDAYNELDLYKLGKEAAIDAFSSIFFIKNKKYEKVIEGAIEGFKVVVKNYSNNKSYSLSQAIDDFSIGFKDAVTFAILGIHLASVDIKKYAILASGAVRFISTNSNKTLKYIGRIVFKKCIFGLGCFAQNTPILMANNSISQSGKIYAMAALPFVPMPVQEVPLLSYALSHKTVNSSYHMTASNNDDVYTGLMNADPYTSAEQKTRDLYEINDTDWNEVVFEQVEGSSRCKLALHNDWINLHGYVTDAIVNMNLPEQGISGPFKITSIKHIIPQKKPVDEDPSNDYGYKPVTGLFIHHSNQVHNITFDNSETLSVTTPHPIFSTTHHSWRLAGELAPGEKVLTYHGEATVTSTEKKAGSEVVYNLEVKDLHNFLVGDLGVVVHNGCMSEYFKLFFGKLTRRKVPGKKWVDYAEESGLGVDDISKKEIDQLERLGTFENKRMIHLDKDVNKNNFQAIDGLYDDGEKVIPVSLKQLELNSTVNTLDQRLSELSKIKAANDLPKFSGTLENVQAMITAKGFTKSEIANRIKGKRNVSEGQRFIKKYFIEGKDGSGWFDGSKWL
jgi:hypothetical protein